jgi:hypothetical protein
MIVRNNLSNDQVPALSGSSADDNGSLAHLAYRCYSIEVDEDEDEPERRMSG